MRIFVRVPAMIEEAVSVISGFEYFTHDPVLLNRVQKEKGINPATWNGIIKRIEGNATEDQIMHILKNAIQTVPPPSDRYPESFKQEYGRMWIKVATQLRTQENAQALLEEWKERSMFRRNAYFYFAWIYFEKSK